MFGNYFRTTYRHLLKSKANFAFKLGGLTIALLSFLVITIYLSFQMSFDKYHDGYKDIYRINSNRDENGQTKKFATVPHAMGPALEAEFPDVKSFTRIVEPTRSIIKYNDKLLRSHGFVEADSSIFNVLTFKFIEGNKHALDRPDAIVLTASLAKQIFGNEAPLGKLLFFPDKENRTFEVTAIIEDLPANTHLTINSITLIQAPPFNPWEITWDGSVYLFVRLDHIVDVDYFAKKINPLIKKHIPKADNGQEERFSVFLQPISNIYLDPKIEMEFFKKGNSLYVYIFSLLGFFLLLIAGINYINLSIADFHNRRKEIGVRQILGASKKQLAFQITLEAVFFCFAGLFISLAILYFLFPRVLQLLDPNLQFSIVFDRKIMTVLGISVFSLAVLSTVYSVFQLSLSSSLSDLKGGGGFGKSMPMGKNLLLFQFIVSIVCISATFIVGMQINYIRTKDLGYDRHDVISLILPEGCTVEEAVVLKNELNKLTGVLSTSYAYYHITGVPYFRGEYEVEVNDAMKTLMIPELFVDHDYLETMNIKIQTGRNFDINNPADFHNAFIVNETAVKEFGWINPIGKRIRVKQDVSDIEKWEGTVVGVTEDFNTRPLHERIEPVVIRLPFDSWPGSCLNIKIEGGTMSETISLIKTTYENIMPPSLLIDIRIVEDMFDAQYREEDKALKVLQIGTWIIILMSSFGIVSLSIYMSIRRMKEFGIRKVLGATVRQIAFLQVGHFLRIAFVANLIALPIAWWMMKEWLEEFAYRTELSGIVFMSVMIISFLLVIISAGYSSWRAGIMNPLDVIKMEN